MNQFHFVSSGDPDNEMFVLEPHATTVSTSTTQPDAFDEVVFVAGASENKVKAMLRDLKKFEKRLRQLEREEKAKRSRTTSTSGLPSQMGDEYGEGNTVKSVSIQAKSASSGNNSAGSGSLAPEKTPRKAATKTSRASQTSITKANTKTKVAKANSKTELAPVEGKKRGRPPLPEEEKKPKKYPTSLLVDMTTEMKTKLESRKEETGVPVMEFIRRLIAREFGNGIPVLGKLSCGMFKDAEQNAERLLMPHEVPQARPGDIGFWADGDSMAPRILHDDLVLVRPGSDWAPGQICVVQIYQNPEHTGPCEATLKRVYQPDPGHELLLKPINPEYSEMRVPAAHAEIVGTYRFRTDSIKPPR